MRDFQRKRGFRNILESWPVLTLLGVLLLAFILGVAGFVGKMQEARKNRKIAEHKISELEKEKEKLSSEIAKLNTERGVEESIREKFGLAKEGEGMIVVVEDKNPLVAPEEEKSNWFVSFFANFFK